MDETFVPTHVVPEVGAPVWEEPDPAAPQHSRVAGSTHVRLIEQRADGWARVAFSNAWEGWLDGRVLTTVANPPDHIPLVRSRTRSGVGTDFAQVLEPIVTGPIALIGAAAAVLGGWMPWLSSGPFDVNAWDLGVVALLRGHGEPSGLKVGVVLLAVALVALPQVTKKPLPTLAVLALGGVACNAAVLVWLQNRKYDVQADVGIGLLLTFAGGAAILADVCGALVQRGKATT